MEIEIKKKETSLEILLNKDRIWIKIKNYIYLIIFLIIFLIILLIIILIFNYCIFIKLQNHTI